MLRVRVFSPKLKPVEVHDLVPCGDEVMHELLLCVFASIDFRNGPEPGVGAEDEVDAGGGPPGLAGLAVAAFEGVMLFGERFPLRAHVEQVDEEVIGERFRA